MPAVTVFGMDGGVAGLAQCDEVISVMRSTLGEGQLVVYLLGRYEPAVL